MSLASACNAFLQLQSQRTQLTIKWCNTVRLMLQSSSASLRSLKFETADASQSLDEIATKTKSIIERLDDEAESGRQHADASRRAAQLMKSIEEQEAHKRATITQRHQLDLEQLLHLRTALGQEPDAARQAKIEQLQSDQQSSMETINELIAELRDELEDADN